MTLKVKVDKIDEKVIRKKGHIFIVVVFVKIEVGSTRKGIRLNHFGFRKMDKFEVILGELKRLFCLSSVQFLWVSEVGEVFMVRVDNSFMRGSLDVMLPIP